MELLIRQYGYKLGNSLEFMSNFIKDKKKINLP
jgi:hypothetical protein